MEQLIADAKAEGSLNTIGLYDDWANYGGLLKAFSAKYGIKVGDDTSTGSSQDQINAVVNRQGQDSALDYLDTGMSFAADADSKGLLAHYSPESASDVSSEFRSSDGTWINHLGGTVAIGCDASRVDACPATFAGLLNPRYAKKIALPGNPVTGESGFMGVLAASLANGGSFSDIKPGVDFFAKLKAAGNFLPVEANAGTIETGETPIVINWDYLLKPIATSLHSKAGIDLKIALPTDGVVSSFYAASINADAPHPAAARLFTEFLFSDEGQNLLLQGYVRPVRLPAMVKAGTADQAALAELPGGADAPVRMPTLEQRKSLQDALRGSWVGAMQ